MSRKAIKSINWSAIAERMTEADKASFSAFKAKSDQYLRRMMANPETSPQIDWVVYSKSIPIPGLVDKFKKQYETLSIPYPEDKYSSKLDLEEKEVAAAVEAFIKQSNADIEKNTKEIERIKGLLPYSQMTMEDYAEIHPENAFDPLNNPTMWPHLEENLPENNLPEKDEHH